MEKCVIGALLCVFQKRIRVELLHVAFFLTRTSKQNPITSLAKLQKTTRLFVLFKESSYLCRNELNDEQI